MWKRFLSHFNVLNGLLFALAAVFYFAFLQPRLRLEVVFKPTVTSQIAEKDPFPLPQPLPAPAPQDFRSIADENLFHPERIIPPEKKPEAALPKPEFVLYGTLITPDLKMAYMEDKNSPVTTPGRGPRQMTLKLGETLSGYQLKEIAPDRVVMVRGEETMTVLLQEPGKSKPRGNGSPPAGHGTPAAAGQTGPAPTFTQPGRVPPLPPGQRITPIRPAEIPPPPPLPPQE
jgi:hypothetical protein